VVRPITPATTRPMPAGGALLGWAGVDATKGRRLSQAALVIGVLGVIANAYSYADVFV
jgi:hypothetical protein